MTKFIASHKKLLVAIYIAMTIVKLFTAEIYLQREEDPTIYFKVKPTLANTFIGSDRAIEYYENRYSWYESKNYREIFHTNGLMILGDIYSALIILWWIVSGGLVVYAVRTILKLAL